MANHTAIVAGVKAMLEARGQTFTTNEDSFQITARVAWALRHEGAALIVKGPAQNGAVYQGVKYSHDAIAFPDGWIDCLQSAGPPANLNEPTWGPTGRSGASLVAPFDLDDAGAIVLPPIVPPPVVVPPAISPGVPAWPSTPPIDAAGLLQVLGVLQQTVTNLATETAQLDDTLQLIDTTEKGLLERLAAIDATLTRIEDRQKLGVSGRLGTSGIFGTTVTLKPPA